jgi:hypothetical protein
MSTTAIPPQHAATWFFRGDTTDLCARYDAIVRDLGADHLLVHLCLEAPGGMLVVDTCPTREAFERFRSDPDFMRLLARHGMPEPEIYDYPVHAVVWPDGS